MIISLRATPIKMLLLKLVKFNMHNGGQNVAISRNFIQGYINKQTSPKKYLKRESKGFLFSRQFIDALLIVSFGRIEKNGILFFLFFAMTVCFKS